MAEPRFTRAALADLTRHLDCLRARDPQAADRLGDDVRRALRLLTEHPLAGRAVEGTTLRVLLTSRYRYRLVYRVRGGIVVVWLMHPAQAG